MSKHEERLQQFAEELVKQIKNNQAPWQKGWKSGLMDILPVNHKGTPYRGNNMIELMMVASIKGYNDNRWYTYNNAQEHGGHVRKGEKGTVITFFSRAQTRNKKDEQGNPILDSEGNPEKETVILDRPVIKTAVVFNAEQIDGLPERELHTPMTEWERHSKAEAIIKGIKSQGVTIEHKLGDKAYYSPIIDKIVMPERGQFESADVYYATILHEIGHSTGHESRLNRDLSGEFGSESYAKEELRAEIASMMIGQELQIGYDPSQHHAYLKSWAKVIKEDPTEILRAVKDADKITEYVLELGRSIDIHEVEKEYSKTIEQNQSNLNITAKNFDNDPASKEVQDRAIYLAQNHTQALIDTYKEMNNTFGGRYIASDMMKEVFEDFNKSPAHRNQFNNAVHNSAASLAAEHFKQMLNEPVKDGCDTVIFLTGCPGAGKTSSVMNNDGKLDDTTKIIFEGQLANAHQNPATIEKIQQAIDNGLKVEITAVNPLPEQALENTFKRFYDPNDGRGAPISTMARIQGNTYEGLKFIHEKFGEQIHLTIIDKPFGNQKSEKYIGWDNLNVLKSQGNEAEITQRLESHLLHHYSQGNINYECFKQSAGSDERAKQLLSGMARPLNQSERENGNGREISSGSRQTSNEQRTGYSGNSSQEYRQISNEIKSSNTLNQRIYLYTSFNDLNKLMKLKEQGVVRFDTEYKVWYAHEDNKDKVAQWATRPNIPTPEQDFVNFLQSKGISVAAGHPIFDEKTHRLSNEGSQAKNVMYQAYPNPDGIPFARVTNFSRGGKPENWQYPKEYLHTLKNIEAVERAKGNQSYSHSQTVTIKPQQPIKEQKELKQDKITQQNLMAERAKMVMSFAPIAPNEQNYLARKQVTANDLVRIVPDSSKLPDNLKEHILIGNTPKQFTYLREHNPYKLVLQRGNLIIPQFNAQGELRAFETITYNGGKYALQDGEKHGLSLPLGNIENGKPIIITEGYATGATLHEQTNRTVLVAFGKDGLLAVAQQIREHCPDSKIYIGADNDHTKTLEINPKTGEPRENDGLVNAQKVAEAVPNTHVLVPQFATGEQGKDWNDVYVDKGVDEFKRQIKEQLNQINPPKEQAHTAQREPTIQERLNSDFIKQNYPQMSNENLKAIQAWKEVITHSEKYAPETKENLLKRLADHIPSYANGEQLPLPAGYEQQHDMGKQTAIDSQHQEHKKDDGGRY